MAGRRANPEVVAGLESWLSEERLQSPLTWGNRGGIQEYCYIAVNNRTGWNATATAAVDRTNSENSLATNCGNLSVSTYTPLGAACLDPDIDWFVVEVPGGPNDGFKYVDSVTDSTTYDYLILNELDTPGTTFYDAQCGNYDPSTGTGYISGARLRTNAHRHEGGTRASYWDQYRDTLNRSSVNWGRIPESLVGSPTTSLGDHRDYVGGYIRAAILTVEAAYAPEPCGASDMGYDGSCVYQGPTNGGPPYASCN